jgi:type III pantothenate kinase
MDYRQLGFLDQLQRLWRDLDVPRQLAIASVTEPRIASLLIELARNLWPRIDVLSPRASVTAFGVKNAYSQPEKLGVDRWLALLATHCYYAGDNCIVDCGTAITVDFIDADGQHRGGLISPGLVLMKKALAQNTAALPFSDTKPDTRPACATEPAINNGSLLAAVGLVEAALQRQPHAYRLILSGGDAETVAGQLSVPFIIDHNLVFKGLLCYSQKQTAV